MILDFLAAALLLIGALFILTATIGIVRMPDLYLRMSAVSKAATLGIACILLGVALIFADVSVSARALAAIIFIMLTAPVASHLIGRAGYITGVPLWQGTIRDDLRGRYDEKTHMLTSQPDNKLV